jgi:hypothetical protein
MAAAYLWGANAGERRKMGCSLELRALEHYDGLDGALDGAATATESAAGPVRSRNRGSGPGAGAFGGWASIGCQNWIWFCVLDPAAK